MRIKDVIRHFHHSGAYGYIGEVDLSFHGMQLQFEQSPPGFFQPLTDESWPDSVAARRLKVDPESVQRAVKDALDRGVTGFVCAESMLDHPALSGQNCFFGPTAAEAFFRLSEAARAARGDSFITAITGSSGKTTTKRMLEHALKAALPNEQIFVSPASFNVYSEVVKYLSMAGDSSHNLIEVHGPGLRTLMNHNFSVSADVSIVTSIAEAHLGARGDAEQVARTKSKIFSHPPAGGTAIINIDTPYANLLVREAIASGCQLVTYGQAPEATVRLVDYNYSSGEVVAKVAGEEFRYVVGAKGKHMALNSLAVVSALRSYRIESWRQGVESLGSFASLEGRGEVATIRTRNASGVTLIDESYNANTGSMRAALDTLGNRPIDNGGRRIAVLGDMLELGEASSQLHRGLADAVMTAGVDVVFLYGDMMAQLYAELKEGDLHCIHWDDLDLLVDHLEDNLQDADTILIKSSKGTGLRKVVTSLSE